MDKIYEVNGLQVTNRTLIIKKHPVKVAATIISVIAILAAASLYLKSDTTSSVLSTIRYEDITSIEIVAPGPKTLVIKPSTHRKELRRIANALRAAEKEGQAAVAATPEVTISIYIKDGVLLQVNNSGGNFYEVF